MLPPLAATVVDRVTPLTRIAKSARVTLRVAPNEPWANKVVSQVDRVGKVNDHDSNILEQFYFCLWSYMYYIMYIYTYRYTYYKCIYIHNITCTIMLLYMYIHASLLYCITTICIYMIIWVPKGGMRISTNDPAPAEMLPPTCSGMIDKQEMEPFTVGRFKRMDELRYFKCIPGPGAVKLAYHGDMKKAYTHPPTWRCWPTSLE